MHVEKTNAVAYIPQPMEVMEALAAACDQVGAKLTQQQSAIAAQTPMAIKSPQLSVQTAAGAFVHGLSAKSNVAQLELLAQMSEEEKQHLATLDTDLAQDPRRAAAKIANQKARLDDLCARLVKMVQASTGAAFAARNALKADLDTKADVARLASEALFAASPLPDVGKATWTKLWEAARKYSDTVAYPKKTFPDPDGTGELCVLCQQPLSEEAINRRVTFETFIKGTTKAAEDAAVKAYDDTIRSAAAQIMSISAVRQLASLISAEIGNEPLAKRVRGTGIRAAWRLRALTRQHDVPSLDVSYPAQELDALSADLARRAALLSADQDSPEHVALVKERGELKDRAALGPLVADIKAEIERRKKAETIVNAAKDTAKRSVTTKNKELSDKLVTNALRGRFAREIEKLKLSRMPVELRKVKDANAVSYFQVCLVEKPDEPVGEIFSEGEHRCVALAAFLAELVTSKQYSGIVFDDPMSSLDHIHRKAVAARLIEEAQHRQVIVFTHDLTFLFELRREAEAQARPVHYQTVCRKQSRPGHIEGEFLQVDARAIRDHEKSSEKGLTHKAAQGWADKWTYGIPVRRAWTAYDGDAIHLKQSKTGKHVTIPVATALKDLLDATPRRAVTILTTTRVTTDDLLKPWTSDGFRASWSKAVAAAGIEGVTFHDLRGTAVTRLALAGCTTPEIAAITGHALKEVDAILDAHYLSRDRGLAVSAIRKPEAHERGTKTPK